MRDAVARPEFPISAHVLGSAAFAALPEMASLIFDGAGARSVAAAPAVAAPPGTPRQLDKPKYHRLKLFSRLRRAARHVRHKEKGRKKPDDHSHHPKKAPAAAAGSAGQSGGDGDHKSGGGGGGGGRSSGSGGGSKGGNGGSDGGGGVGGSGSGGNDSMSGGGSPYGGRDLSGGRKGQESRNGGGENGEHASGADEGGNPVSSAFASDRADAHARSISSGDDGPGSHDLASMHFPKDLATEGGSFRGGKGDGSFEAGFRMRPFERKDLHRDMPPMAAASPALAEGEPSTAGASAVAALSAPIEELRDAVAGRADASTPAAGLWTSPPAPVTPLSQRPPDSLPLAAACAAAGFGLSACALRLSRRA